MRASHAGSRGLADTDAGWDSLPARWVAPDDLGDSHQTQEKREKLCKMIAITLYVSVSFLFEDLSCGGTRGFSAGFCAFILRQ